MQDTDAEHEESADTLRLKDVEIKVTGDRSGVIVSGRGDNRAVLYEELVELAEADGPVTIR